MKRSRRRGGQAIVEFALVLPLLFIFLMGIIDLGRGIYLYNGVSQAAREIARAVSVHPGAPLGSSPEVAAVIDIQMNLVPGMADPRISSGSKHFIWCEYPDGTKVGNGFGTDGCAAPNVVRVEVHANYEAVALLGFADPFDLMSSSTNAVQ
jgi:hypothetical protein